MKSKWFVAMSMAVIMVFTTAVGLCIHALNQPQMVLSAADNQLVIVLDAGHGGMDGGVVGKCTKIKESTLNLQITQRLQYKLGDMGFTVVLTRKTDAGLYGLPTNGFKKRDMQKRKEIIQETNPDMVLSIHQNYYPAGSARGGQVFHNGEECDALLAESIQERLNAMYAEQGVKARMCKTGDYFMLGCTAKPSVIVECGFLSNAKDENLLIDDVFQDTIAQAIAGGVVAYLSQCLS